MFAFRYQPLKSFYVVYTFLSILFVRLPYWCIISAIPASRPRPSWSMSRSILLHGCKAIATMLFATGAFPSVDIEAQSKTIDSFVWVDGVPEDLVRGEIADMAKQNNVKSIRVHGYWYGKKGAGGGYAQPASKDERVLYHFHGGGFLAGTASPTGQYAPIMNGILEHAGGVVDRAFGLDFRLASAAPRKVENPFPAQLLDAIAGYRYLVHSVGFSPDNIIIGGDSAGAHLAISLCLYLNRYALPGLSPPRALILLSPTADWACTHNVDASSSLMANSSSDYAGVYFLSGYTATALRGSLPLEEVRTNIWLSPSSLNIANVANQFSNFPPTCIIASGDEQSLDGIRTIHRRLAGDNPDKSVVYWEYPNSLHDFVALKIHEPERSEALNRLHDWLKTVLY
ncbi:alpha/beta-hydrolase [Hygrophoropsis aurantiaca]|uniref:Alpha/beta-hydrolase n=1 Tax=Hygrophoropsis aurantiaca TaxID=72124 RepID=A0ACB7ZUS2_9AGAM|nr:alpha/beta-hydrolase [Hygrophoropsis aurantiaca]